MNRNHLLLRLLGLQPNCEFADDYLSHLRDHQGPLLGNFNTYDNFAKGWIEWTFVTKLNLIKVIHVWIPSGSVSYKTIVIVLDTWEDYL